MQTQNLTMWVILSFCSAALLGLYDLAKKRSLQNNAVLPVLFLNTALGSLLFLPLILGSYLGFKLPSCLTVASLGMKAHAQVLLKSLLVLASWILGYFGIKHLPITLVGPINATRPVMVLLGAIVLFGEELNGYQWAGVLTAILSFFLLSRSGRKEGVHFAKNRWIWMVIGASVLGACSGLYDKHLLRQLPPMFVQAWFTVYQMGIMSIILGWLWWPKRSKTTPFRWEWSIVLIPLFLTAADFLYFYALTDTTALIAVISMIRRGSVVVSFFAGAVLFRESNIKSKSMDLLLVVVSLALLWFGSR